MTLTFLPNIYLETSVISYLTARPSKNVISLARQSITKEWWENSQSKYDFYISALIIKEAQAGDREASKKRLEFVSKFSVLNINNEVEYVAKLIVERGIISHNYEDDSLHIAIAAIHGMDYLLTWNFHHINNVEVKKQCNQIFESMGIECPTICSPKEIEGIQRWNRTQSYKNYTRYGKNTQKNFRTIYLPFVWILKRLKKNAGNVLCPLNRKEKIRLTPTSDV